VRATKVNAGLAESNGKLLPGLWRELLHVTCGLTLGNEYGKTLPLPTFTEGGPVDEWLACWTQAQKGPGSNRSRDAVG